MALSLRIPTLNHGSTQDATEVQTSGGTVTTVVDEYKDRLTKAMEDEKVSPAQLARDLKISYQAVAKVLNGGRFGVENNLKAARRLKVRSEWLATGKGQKHADSSEAIAWRFSDELMRVVLSLTDEELFDAENVLRAHLHISTLPLVQLEEAKNPRSREHFHQVTARHNQAVAEGGNISSTLHSNLLVRGEGASTDERSKPQQVQKQRTRRNP
jgi:transcriptional regulator with XRE-family HTH domain